MKALLLSILGIHTVLAANALTNNLGSDNTRFKLRPQFAYITDSSRNNVIKCNVEDNGNLSGCADSGAKGLSSPHGITFNSEKNWLAITMINSM